MKEEDTIIIHAMFLSTETNMFISIRLGSAAGFVQRDGRHVENETVVHSTYLLID
jgi:hypothetical protein